METFRRPSTHCVRALTAGTTAALVIGGSVLAGPAAFAAEPASGDTGTGTGLLGTVGSLLGGVTAPITAPITGNGNGTAAGLLSGTGLLDGSTVGVPVTVPVNLPITIGNGTSLDPTTVVSPTTSPSTGVSAVSPTTGVTLSPTTGTTVSPTTGGGVVVAPTTGTSSTGTATTAPSPTTSTAPTDSTPARTLVRVEVTRSVSTVYPRKDGFTDTVRFGVRPIAADGSPIGVRGTAVLTKGSKVVKTWTVAPSTATVTWNGRMANKVVPGAYTLTVTGGSADGVVHTGKTSVTVSGKRLVTKTVTTKSLTVPAEVRAGIKLAAARVQVTTTATASSTGRLQLHLGAKKTVISVKNGVHRSASLVVPSNSAGVRFTKQWKAGQVQLKALSVRWTYKKLV